MTLSTSQLVVLKAAILAEIDPTFVADRTAGATGAMAAFYNDAAVPSFTVWKSNVSIGAVGDNIVGTELAGLSSLNNTRLQSIIGLSPAGVNPSLPDRRAFFDDVFSTGGTATRAKLLILWKRLAKRGEKLYATGTGSDAIPATLVFEGDITNTDVVSALALP